MEILYYVDSRGQSSVHEWLLGIQDQEEKVYRKVHQRLVMLEMNGELIRNSQIKKPDIKQLTGTNSIWQIRAYDYRIMFFFFEDKVILTNHFKKEKKAHHKAKLTELKNEK